MSITIEKVLYKHYRVPEIDLFYVSKMTGKPSEFLLERYDKRFGFESNYGNGYDFHNKPCNRGGKTVCVLVLSNGNEIQAESVCSLSDNFNRKTGRRLSFKRAYDKYLNDHDGQPDYDWAMLQHDYVPNHE